MLGRDELDLSVVIIAYNEEANLERCLKSLPSGIELILVDSESTDATAAIALRYGARVYQKPFTNFADQKNTALSYANRQWVLAVDADEELDVDLRAEILRLIQDKPLSIAAFRLRRRLVFMGRRMYYGKTEDKPLRFFKRGFARYQGSIHEELVVASGSETATLKVGTLWHYSYRDLSDYFQRFNRYTTAIAEKHAREGRKVPFVGHILRPWLEFFGRYFLRLGFLDGYPGYTYALISSLYAYIKYAKLVEIERISAAPLLSAKDSVQSRP